MKVGESVYLLEKGVAGKGAVDSYSTGPREYNGKNGQANYLYIQTFIHAYVNVWNI